MKKIMIFFLVVVLSAVIYVGSIREFTPNQSYLGEIPSNFIQKRVSSIFSTYPSHTDIPRNNFTGNYNVTLFANPDNADEVIFRYLQSAESSIYVSMYTISRPDFNKTLIDLKKSNPSMDIQVLISYRRVGKTENIDTAAAAESLVDNNIQVYNSTKDNENVDGYYHAKYWIIDNKHVFVYSGNWSPRSVTPQLEPGDDDYSSSEGNRDMGIAVHDASDIASFFKIEVWDKDVEVADKWPSSVNKAKARKTISNPLFKVDSLFTYTPTFESLNIKEEMTLSPMFTPDNALDIHKEWIDLANDTIEVQNQYITQFDDNVDWDNDPSPIVRSLVNAQIRGVKVRVQVNEDSDSDDVTKYFLDKGIEVRWMGNKTSSPDKNWLSETHNKLVIIDSKVTLLSSINFGENAFTNNREAGFVIQSNTVAGYYSSIFTEDWIDGEIPPFSLFKGTLTTDDTKTSDTDLFDTPFSWSVLFIATFYYALKRRKQR